MRTLFVFDYKDYKEDGTVGTRPSARGIIVRDGRIAMVHSRKAGNMTIMLFRAAGSTGMKAGKMR